MNRHLQRTANTGPLLRHRLAPQRKLISALTAAALLSMAAISPALAAPPVTFQFAPVAGQATPSALSFHIPLAAGESIADIRFQAGGSETSLLSVFELTPASGGVSARFLPALDFSPYTGQSLALKVVKIDGATAGIREALFQIRIIPASDLQQDLKLLAVTDGTAQADALEFTLPGALNASLEDLLLMVSATPGPSVKNAFTLRPDLGGNTLVSLRGLDMDPAAGQALEVRALKTLDGNATPLMQKLTLTPLSAGEFTRDVTLPVAVSGDAQPDPFTLALAAEANVEVTDITLGAASVLSLFNLTRAGNGALSAQLATPLDFDPLIGQSIALGVRKSVAGASYQQRIILAVALPAPRLLSRDDGNIAVNGGPAASSTLRNPQYVLYSDAAGTAEAARSATGSFADLIADTGYYAAIVAEALDPATSAWAAQKSPLLAVSTQQANPDAFTFSPASGVSRGAEVISNSITVSGIRGRARISVADGQYSIDNGVWTSAAGTVSNGQSVRVRASASGSYSSSTTATLTIGTRSGNFVVTTMAEPVVDYTPPDTTPNAFTFVDQTNVALSTLTESAAITVGGIDAAASISVAGGEYQINGGAWTAAAGSVSNGQTVKVRHTSSGSNATATNTTLTIGGVPDIFTTTTVAAGDGTQPATPTIALSDGNAANGTGSAGYTNSTAVNIVIGNDTDNVGVTGWYVSESSSAPAAGDGGWVGARPTTASVSAGDGVKTLYVWTKDAAGNVSNAGSGTIELGTVAPSTLAWVTGAPDTKDALYTNLILSGDKSFTGASIAVASRNGGTVGTVAIDGSGQITMADYTTPNVNPDYLDVTGSDKYGNTISIARRVNLPN